MPPVVAFLTTVGSIFGLAGTAAAIAGAAAIVGSVVIARALMPKIDMGVVDTDRARQTTVRSTIEPRKLVYGETMISGVVSFAQVNGANNKNLHQVIAIAGHKLTSIDKIFFDDYSIDLSSQVDGNGDVTSGKFAKKTNEDGTLETMVHIETRDGSTTQTAYSDLVTAFAGTGLNAGKGYESTHRGDGVASIYTRWTIHEGSRETWDEVGGIQNIKAVVKGKAVYDPRLDVAAGNDAGDNPTTAAYIKYSDGATTATHQRDLQGQNPALMLADYLMDSSFGLGVPASKIDWDAVITAADACDYLVPIPTSQTQKRFFGSGVIFGSDNHRKSISKILSGMNGDLIYSQGKYIIKAGIHEASSLAFTEDDLAGDFTVKTSIPRADRFNTIKGMFIDPESNYKMTEFSPRTVSGAVARDNGEVLEEEIKLTFTSDRYVAQRIAIKKVNQSFLQTTLSLPVNLKGMKVAVGDRITLALNDFATIDADWNPSKEFKVIGWSFSESGNGAIDLSLVEDDEDRYADPAEGDYNQISNTGVIISSLAQVPSPTNFTATAGYNSVNLAWTNPTNIGAWEQIWIYASNTTTPPATPIEKFRGTAFTHQIAGGTVRYYWIQAVKYPLGSTPASGSTNTSKSALVPFEIDGSIASVTALKIANAVMETDSIDADQIVDGAVGSAQINTTLESTNWSTSGGTAGWQILKSGAASFKTAVISGNISATTGTIGGFTVGSTDLIAGDETTRVSLSTSDGISLGDNTFADAPFSVTPAGALKATDATITGDITADTLTVAEANITNALTLGGGVLQDGSGNNLTTTTTLNANQIMSEVTGVLSQAQHAIPSFYRITTDDALAPSNSEFNAAAGRLPKVNDIVITTDTTVTNPVTPNRTYGWTCTVAGTASTEATWGAISDFISGDLLVDGTVTADQIAANAVTAGKINVTNLQAIQSDLGNITAGTLKGGGATAPPDADAAPSGSESGSFFDLNGGKFVVGDASKSLLFDGTNLTMTGDVRVKGEIEADALIVNNQFRFFGKEFFIARGVEDGSITDTMLSNSAVNLLQGSLAQSVGGSNGDFKEGSGSFTSSGGNIVLGTSGDLFDHGELAIDLEANFSFSFYGSTSYAQDTFTLQFQVSTDGTNYTNVGTSQNVQISKYDLSSYYPGSYFVYFCYEDITQTISAASLSDNVDYYIRALITSVPSSVASETVAFTFSANEGVTGVTSTGGNADTLDNLDSTAFLRSNVNDTFDADLTITGNLTVQGTTTTVDTDNLTVKDNNITLNYSTGDSSSTANDAGITIQDAVNATTDASILWKTATDRFDFSHGITVNQSGDAINLRSTTDGDAVRITFSSRVPADQIGHIEYTHVNGGSYGSLEAFIISGTEASRTILADGKLMFKEGLYIKPASGTGAGTLIINSSGNMANIGNITATGLVIADRFYSGLGTAASPAFKVGDADSGFYDSGANMVGLALGGVLEYDFQPTQLDLNGNNIIDAGTISSGAISSTGIVIGGSGATPTGSVIGKVRSYGTASAYMGASDESGRTAFFGVDSSGYAMFGALTNHDAVIRANNNPYLRVKTNSNVQVVSGSLQMGTITVIDAARNITSTGLTVDTSAGTLIVEGFGAGSNKIRSDGSLKLSATGGSVALQHGATERLETTSTGILVTGTISSGGITTVGASVFNSYSASDPDSTSRTNYPAGNMFTHYSQANGVSIIGGQGGYTGSSLTIGEETGRSANFKLIRGISDTNGTPAEEFSINGVGDAVFAGTISSGAVTSSVFVSTIVDPGNPSPGANNLRVSGYGVIGNRGNLYLTNSNASGQIVFGISGAHNANPKLTLTTTGATFAGTISSGAITSTGALSVDVPSGIAATINSGTTNVVARFESEDAEAWIDIQDSNSGTYGVLIGHDNTNLLKIADQGVNVRMSLSNAGLVTADRFLSGVGTAVSPAFQVGDTNSGFYDSGANEVGVSLSGVLEYEFTPTTFDMKNNLLTGVNQITVGSGTSGGVARFRGANYNQINISHSGNASWGMLLTNSNSTSNGNYHYSTSGAHNSIAVVNVNNDALHFGTNNDAKMTIDHGGDVSILDGVLKMGSTTVIDGSRNAINLTTVGVGTASVTSGYMMEIKNINEAAILIRADYDNIGEDGNAIIKFSQDNTIIESTIGLTADNNYALNHLYAGANILFQFAGATRFTMTNGGAFTATGNITAYSDERLKQNIQTLDGSKVLQMRGVSFTKDEEEGSGVIAQELELIAPELVHTADDEMGTKSVAYGNLVGYLIENAKQQQTEIDELKALVKKLMEK